MRLTPAQNVRIMHPDGSGILWGHVVYFFLDGYGVKLADGPISIDEAEELETIINSDNPIKPDIMLRKPFKYAKLPCINPMYVYPGVEDGEPLRGLWS